MTRVATGRQKTASTTRPLADIDRAKLRAALQRLDDELAHDLLLAIVEVVPLAKLAPVVGRFVRLDMLRPASARGRRPSLLDEVRAFDTGARRGAYYDAFDVDSRNFMATSVGTRAFIAECRRLLDRCVDAAAKQRPADTREAFEIMFALLRHVDDGHDDVVFFADEGGSWQVGVDWKAVLPAWFQCAARVEEPDALARAVIETVDALDREERRRHFDAIRRLAAPEQRMALDGRLAESRRR